MVLVLPPAPAALVLLGRAFATLSFWSAAARLRIAVFGPPGGVGDEGLPLLWAIGPPGEFTGDEGRGEDWRTELVLADMIKGTLFSRQGNASMEIDSWRQDCERKWGINSPLRAVNMGEKKVLLEGCKR